MSRLAKYRFCLIKVLSNGSIASTTGVDRLLVLAIPDDGVHNDNVGAVEVGAVICVQHVSAEETRPGLTRQM